jgi:hypothetical protein
MRLSSYSGTKEKKKKHVYYFYLSIISQKSWNENKGMHRWYHLGISVRLKLFIIKCGAQSHGLRVVSGNMEVVGKTAEVV